MSRPLTPIRGPALLAIYVAALALDAGLWAALIAGARVATQLFFNHG